MPKVEPIGRGGKLYGWQFYCPGCKEWHVIPEGRWARDGSPTWPTFYPSLVNKVNTPDLKDYQPQAHSSVCHVVITKGDLRYQADCTHELRGKTVPMQDVYAVRGRVYPPPGPGLNLETWAGLLAHHKLTLPAERGGP